MILENWVCEGRMHLPALIPDHQVFDHDGPARGGLDDQAAVEVEILYRHVAFDDQGGALGDLATLDSPRDRRDRRHEGRPEDHPWRDRGRHLVAE